VRLEKDRAGKGIKIRIIKDKEAKNLMNISFHTLMSEEKYIVY